MSKLKILYVDDDFSAITNFRYTLADCPLVAEITTFQHPEQAVAYIRENHVDMAFLDVDLGSTTGFVLCQDLRAVCPELPVAFVTGNIDYMRRANRVVKAPYIFKPYDKEDLVAALPKET